MKRTFIWSIVAILVFGALGISVYWMRFGTDTKLINSISTQENIPEHPLIFYDEKLFYQGVAESKKTAPESSTFDIKGGIIPHHLLASKLIADFFQRLQSQKPDTVILIGPNHPDLGEFEVVTSKYQWKTPFGAVIPNTKVIDSLIDKNIAHINEDVIVREHSVAGIMPYIKYYLPETKVVPIILKYGIDEQEINRLTYELTNSHDQHMVIIASVDFSHYLSSAEADKKDETTLPIMKQFDYRKLLMLNNEYLDSPPSIVAVLMSMQKLNAENFELLDHTNASKLTNIDFTETTSYFSIAFH